MDLPPIVLCVETYGSSPLSENEIEIEDDFEQKMKRSALDREILKEIEELSSLELDSQFIPDVLLCPDKEPPSPKGT